MKKKIKIRFCRECGKQLEVVDGLYYNQLTGKKNQYLRCPDWRKGWFVKHDEDCL